MSYPILAVDRDREVCRREQAGWNRRGIDTVRVDSMCEALQELARSTFLFTTINEDNIHYLPALRAMREVSPSPIFIITSSFTINKQVEALGNGADVYAPFQGNVEDNIISALALLQRHGEQHKGPRSRVKVESYRKLLVLPGLRQVFCDDVEISLTKTEFDLLRYLLANRGITVTFRQIYHRVWGTGYDAAHQSLWNHVLRLRKKIAQATGEGGYIENVRNVGYRLPP